MVVGRVYDADELFAGAGHWSNATAFAFGQEGRFFVDPSQYVPVRVLLYVPVRVLVFCWTQSVLSEQSMVRGQNQSFPDLSKRMTRDQTIQAVTIDAAQSARMANKIGSIWKAQPTDPPD